MDVGELIKRYRDRRGMTQAELALEVGVSRGRVSHWENGRTFIGLDAARKLAKKLRVRIGHLTGELLLSRQ